MAFLKKIEINHFRGIQQLKISDFSDINLIVGDNNSGKTSLLEAFQLLFIDSKIGDIKGIINQRTVLKPGTNSFYTSFIKLFNIGQQPERLNFSIHAESDTAPVTIELIGTEESISGEDALHIASLSTRQKLQYTKGLVPETVKMFSGSIISKKGSKRVNSPFKITSLDNGPTLFKKSEDIQYISPFGHMRYDLLQNIVENQEYKKLAINILKQFDPSISDICYTKADDGTFMETAITDTGVSLPFSVYGDGIKKILYILNKMLGAPDSILLIDEIENGLHKKYYDLLFPVVFELARKMHIQLFIATHSMEAIEAILQYGNYDNAELENDPIRVITLKKVLSDDGSNIVARNITGKYVYDNRKVFEFEVRI